MTIKVEKTERWGYTVYFNDEVILECVAEDELKDVTIGMLMEFAEDAK